MLDLFKVHHKHAFGSCARFEWSVHSHLDGAPLRSMGGRIIQSSRSFGFDEGRSMPKRKRKILIGTHHPVKCPQFDWQLIEEAYGRPLDQTVRQRIQEVTIEFASDAIFELTVAPVADARKEIERILSAAERLREAIPEPSAPVDGAFYARHLLMNHIRDPLLPNPTVMPYRDPVQAVSQILTSC